ncbi:hypothetical protein [Streptomyces neyagawaensis]|uniref:hypothetical protein n=1 Tax=Streptomyces neyagawaensis TaxID=42238 RepID=UPI0006E1B49A|nr:hypothetical protein [Streptomyces neyagawaensis]MCL6737045.1 hypothetical protein [Streptomyces neyagawaensis]MDE1687057.1 hypothetical protein [Streptomyces neyagawaensis]
MEQQDGAAGPDGAAAPADGATGPEGTTEPPGVREPTGVRESAEVREPAGVREPTLPKEQRDRIAEHVIGHVIGGAIIGVMAWAWTHSPTGFAMTVIWAGCVYGWNKSPLVRSWSRRRRIRLGIALTTTYWLFAFLIM